MSSPEAAAQHAQEREDARQNRLGVWTLLDAAFGHFVWAGHFLAIYIATAVSCQLGLGAAGTGTRNGFLIVLALFTLAAGAAVVLHGLRRYRQLHDVPERRFRMRITVGNDAVALVGILWQMFAIALVPLCA